MPELTVTLVDHASAPDNLKMLIMRALEDIFTDLLDVSGELSTVNMRWSSAPAPGDQDVVLHFVEKVASSYVSQKMAGKAHRIDGGGFTRHVGNKAGSEFYLLPLVDGKPSRFTAKGYAKIAAHEAMHNVTRQSNLTMHGQGGIGASPPQLPVNDKNREKFQAALGNIPEQLL